MATSQNPKRKRRLLIFGGSFIVLALIFYFGAEPFVENLIAREVQKQLNSNPSRQYDLKTGKIKIRFLSGNIWVDDLTLTPSDSAWQLWNNGSIKSLFDLHLNGIKIRGLKALRFLRDKNMEIKLIKASDIHLDIYSNPDWKGAEEQKKLKLADIFTDEFIGANIDKFEIENFAVNRYLYADTGKPALSLDSLYLSFITVKIDSQTIKKVLPLQFENLKINSSDFLVNTSRFYKIATRDIAFNLTDSTFIVDGFQLIPRYSKYDFSDQIKYNTDWFNIGSERIEFQNIHLSELVQGKVIHLEAIHIHQPVIEIFRDKTLPESPYKQKPLVATMLRKIPMDVMIDSLIISEGKLVYEETPKDRKESGKLFFEPFTLKASNFTNMDSVIAQNNSANIKFESMIMGKTMFSANITADLSRTDDYFEVEGKLDRMPATVLNPLVENLLLVSVVSGDIKKTQFYFYANNDNSSGEVFLEYENLKIEILQTDDKSKQRVAQSFVANNLIRNDNLSSDRKYLVGQINFERDKNKGMPNYIWKSIQSGIVSVIAPVASKDSKEEKRKGKKSKNNH